MCSAPQCDVACVPVIYHIHPIKGVLSHEVARGHATSNALYIDGVM